MTALADRPTSAGSQRATTISESDLRLNQMLSRVLAGHIAPSHLGFVLATLRATITAHLLTEASARSGEQTGPGTGPLSDREMQVLRGMSQGRSNGHIGRSLYLSEDTVKTHARRLYRKLGVRDRAHAVHVAWERGLLGPAK